MYCLKCGRETPENQVFCDTCLQVMQQYPIKPGTAVQLPQRNEPKKPATRKKILSAKEQLQLLRRANQRLRRAVAILAAVICILGAMLAYAIFREDVADAIGKNYTIDTTMTP